MYSNTRIALSIGLIGLCMSLVIWAPARSIFGNDHAGSTHRPRKVSVNAALAAQQNHPTAVPSSSVVVGKFADGVERDLTSTSALSVSDLRIARVDAVGRIVGDADGRAILMAANGGFVARAEVSSQHSLSKRRVNFYRDISGILSKRGCNASTCHGGVKGRGGLKLSLDALDPREDYRWITQGGTYQVLSPEPLAPMTPRVNLQEPDQSLLLQKPTASIPHGGGELFAVGSRDYELILDWIREGARFGDEKEIGTPVKRLEVFPREFVLDPGGKQQLLVTARRSDGTKEDVSELVRFEGLDTKIARVSEDGLIEAGGSGETVVLVRGLGHVSYARVGVTSGTASSYPQVPRNNFIDNHIFAKLEKLRIVPSPLSTDEGFIRRVCLDVTGTLPPPRRVREFLNSRDPQKREKLIEILLNSPEYVDFWTFRFADLLRAGIGGYDPEVHMSWEWVRKSIATNKPYDEIAMERIAAQGYDGPSRHFRAGGETARFEKVMAEQVRVFMGRRMDCAQCHNHPNESWTQDQFWGLAAFFARRTQTAWNSDQVIFDDPDGHEMKYGEMGKTSVTFVKAVNPRTKEEVLPKFLDGKPLPEAAREDLRRELAEWMTSHPYFAEAIVNRMWRYFMGKGLVEPVDDFRSTNPPTHPELLDALARDFQEHGHDLKRLIRQIVSSRAYQLSSLPNESNIDEKTNYSHTQPRFLEAEVVLDAISSATGVPEIFENVSGKVPVGTRAINLTLPAKYPSLFLEIYGRPFRDTVPERNVKPSLAQALHILVGSTYTQKLNQPSGRLDTLLKSGASDAQIVEELYLGALSRFPTEKERSDLERLIGQEPSRKEALAAVLWALLSSREFSYNH